MALCSKASVSSVTLCYPLFVRPMRRTLEGGRRNPQKGDGRLLRARPGQCRDIRPVRRISSVTIGPVRPSPLPRRHPGHCSAISNVVGVWGRQDAATPATMHLTASRRLHPRVSDRTTTKREAPTPPPSKPLLDEYRARHDAPLEARFARTAIYSTALFAMPSHVCKTVWHTCKLPPLGL
jgi:hypothetical protein